MALKSIPGGIGATQPCRDCPVRARSICQALDSDALAELSRQAHMLKLRRGETLFWEDEEARVVATLRSGILARTASLADGREQIIGLVMPGDFVGRHDRPTSDHRVTAISDAVLCVFPRTVFARLAEENVALERALLRRALDDLEHARRWMLLLSRMSAEERITTFLLELARASGAGRGERIAIPLSRQQIADLLGLTIETVSRKLHALCRQGVIALPDRHNFVATDLAALAGLRQAA